MSTPNRRTHLAFSPLVLEPSVLPLAQIRFGKNNLPWTIIASAALPLTVWPRSIMPEYPDSDSKVNIVDRLYLQHTSSPVQEPVLVPHLEFRHVRLDFRSSSPPRGDVHTPVQT